MKIVTRLCALATLSFAIGSAFAQAGNYPNKPVRVIVPTVPGPLDAFARSITDQIAARLKQPFVIENKPGAGGNLGADMVAKAPADGYTLLFAIDTTLTVNPSLYKKMPFDVEKDLVTISVPVTYGQVLAVNPAVKAKNLGELMTLAKQQKLTYASGGNGSPSHLTMAAFLANAGVEMTHVPYKGTGASVIDVMGGQVDSVFAVGSGILPQAQAGKLRALAVSSSHRSLVAPEVPTVAESGYPGFNASFAYAFMAPAGTPPEIVQLLAAELARAMATPEQRERNRANDYAATNLNPQQSAAWLRDARKRWSEVILKSNITME